MLKKKYLLSPGPTPLPQEVQAAAACQIIHHRSPEFSELFASVTKSLQYIFQTRQEVFILTSSGTGAMEAAVVNTLCPGDKVITLNCGKFGARWAHICRTYGIEVAEVRIAWGENFTPVDLEDLLRKHPTAKAVFSTLSATSTGTIYDIHGFGKLLRDTETILIVDGISGVGAMPCPMDEWAIDVLISGSQKAFMTPPGLAYIALSDKAWKMAKKSTLPKFYFDVKTAKNALQKKTSAWTPGTSLIIQQQKALNIMQSLGLEYLFKHHAILGSATRAAVKSIGLELLSKNPGNILTAVKIPHGLDGIKLTKTIQQKYQVYIAGAQDPHKGKFFRIGHLGYTSGFDIITALSALEMALLEQEYKFTLGSSIRAAQEILKENWT